MPGPIRFLQLVLIGLACLLSFTSLAELESASIATQAKPSNTISPFEASYTLKKGGVPVAEVKRQLRKTDDNLYIFESHSKPIGIATFFVKDIIVERSEWQYIHNHFQPQRYSYQRTGGKKNRNIKLVFDWEKNKVTNIINDDAWKMDVPDHVQDKLLYQLSIMHDLNGSNEQLHYEVADGGRLKDYSFSVQGTETLQTDIGQVETVKIKRNINKKSITIWCAIEHNYLPVRIEQDDEDGRLDLYIDSVAGL